jgi:hypothetical protein
MNAAFGLYAPAAVADTMPLVLGAGMAMLGLGLAGRQWLRCRKISEAQVDTAALPPVDGGTLGRAVHGLLVDYRAKLSARANW